MIINSIDIGVKTSKFAEKQSGGRGMSFVICEVCFWCASHVNPIRQISSCARCSSPRVTSIPLAENECYRYTLSERGGLDIDFATCKESFPRYGRREQASIEVREA